MKAIKITNKTFLIRHWFKWYRVKEGAADWQPLEIKRKAVSLDQSIKSMKKAGHIPKD